MKEKNEYLKDAYDALARTLHETGDDYDSAKSEFTSYLNLYLKDQGLSTNWTDLLVTNLEKFGVEEVLNGMRKIDPDRKRAPSKGERFYE